MSDEREESENQVISDAILAALLLHAVTHKPKEKCDYLRTLSPHELLVHCNQLLYEAKNEGPYPNSISLRCVNRNCVTCNHVMLVNIEMRSEEGETVVYYPEYIIQNPQTAFVRKDPSSMKKETAVFKRCDFCGTFNHIIYYKPIDLSVPEKYISFLASMVDPRSLEQKRLIDMSKKIAELESQLAEQRKILPLEMTAEELEELELKDYVEHLRELASIFGGSSAKIIVSCFKKKHNND